MAASDSEGIRSQATSVPTPDPTILTREAVDRAIASYREVVEARLGAMDQATKLVASDLVKIEQASEKDHERAEAASAKAMHAEREFILSQIKIVADVANERFAAIEGTFASNALALAAALAAQKEAAAETNKANTLAIGKSEQATKETISSNALLSTTAIDDLRRQINALASRLDRGESAGEASQTVRTQTKAEERLNIGQVMIAISILIAAAGLLVNALRR
jgi:hypothetical protein